LEQYLETIADFEVQYSQFLDPDGKPSPDIPDLARETDKLLDMYRHMTETRVFDAKAINLQRTGKLGTYASCLGHEATHIGIGAAMREDDVLAPSYREYGSMFYRGVTMDEVLLYWGGDERGSDFAGPRHDFPFCVPIATQCLHAAGAAMAFQLRGEKRCAVSINGDGGTSDLSQSATFARARAWSGVRLKAARYTVAAAANWSWHCRRSAFRRR
jgi:pyruvate dehydrogenase E1 component alpha subunit